MQIELESVIFNDLQTQKEYLTFCSFQLKVIYRNLMYLSDALPNSESICFQSSKILIFLILFY